MEALEGRAARHFPARRLHARGGRRNISCLRGGHGARAGNRAGRKFFALRARRTGHSTSRRLERMPALKAHPLAEAVREASEGVSFLIRAQQGQNGGVLAGHNYHLSYVRDQYGTFRGLLAMGCLEEAAAIVRFSHDVFARSGRLANAQGIGVPGSFHEHEKRRRGNHRLPAIAIHKAIGSDREPGIFRQAAAHAGLGAAQARSLSCTGACCPSMATKPMWRAVFCRAPRSNHGSFEATMLLSRAASAILAQRRAEEKEDWIRQAKEALADAERQFEDNFRRKDGYIANSLARLEGLTEPAYRHGMCPERRYLWLAQSA